MIYKNIFVFQTSNVQPKINKCDYVPWDNSNTIILKIIKNIFKLCLIYESTKKNIFTNNFLMMGYTLENMKENKI